LAVTEKNAEVAESASAQFVEGRGSY